MGSYFLPDAITEMWEPARDFAFAKFPSGHSKGCQNICAISLASAQPQLIVVTAEGYFYQYSVDTEAGGECVLLKQYSLLEGEDDVADGQRA